MEKNKDVLHPQEVNDVDEDVNETIHVDGSKPLMIWQLGDRDSRWLPGPKHFKKVRRFIERSRYEDKYNVFLFHYACKITIVDSRPWYKRLWNPTNTLEIHS